MNRINDHTAESGLLSNKKSDARILQNMSDVNEQNTYFLEQLSNKKRLFEQSNKRIA